MQSLSLEIYWLRTWALEPPCLGPNSDCNSESYESVPWLPHLLERGKVVSISLVRSHLGFYILSTGTVPG